jgi:hypothetical protein
MGEDGNKEGSRPVPQPDWSPLAQMWMSVPVSPRPAPMAGVRTQKAASSVSAPQASNRTLPAPSARVRPGREGGVWMGEGVMVCYFKAFLSSDPQMWMSVRTIWRVLGRSV